MRATYLPCIILFVVMSTIALHLPVTSFPVGPNIRLTTLFWDILSLELGTARLRAWPGFDPL